LGKTILITLYERAFEIECSIFIFADYIKIEWKHQESKEKEDKAFICVSSST